MGLYYGRRIRPRDKSLVYRSFFFRLLLLFASVFGLFHGRWLLGFYKSHRLPERAELKNWCCSWYFVASVIVTVLVCCLYFYVRYHYFIDSVRRRQHIQKIACMILENGWYETEKGVQNSFFKDVPMPNKERIVWFPRIYYRMKRGELIVKTEISMGKYQDQLSHLEKKLESGLFCELVDKELRQGIRGTYVEYHLLYDMIVNRIGIEEVKAEAGRLRLMKNIWWEYDNLPHMLIAGGTGGGKTYFLLTIIYALLQSSSKLVILDPKNADLADLSSVMPDVYYRKEDMMLQVRKFCEEMQECSDKMKQMPGYQTGNNYAVLGLPAHFLIFDEYVAFMEMLTSKESTELLSYLKKIIMLGRQAGFFLILACQRPDAKYLGDGIRDQFNFRVALGRVSDTGYGMMFSDADKEFFLKQIKGRGYADAGKGVVSEFYAPLVPKGYDFLKAVSMVLKSRHKAVSLDKPELNKKEMEEDKSLIKSV